MAVKDLDSPKGRIVIRAEDFSSWLVEDLTWNWGLTASFYDKPSIKLLSSSNGIPVTSLLSNSKLDFSEIEKEKEKGSFQKYFIFLTFAFNDTTRFFKNECRSHSKRFPDSRIVSCNFILSLPFTTCSLHRILTE